jgi:sirohydrochlorin cobaltochelatase
LWTWQPKRVVVIPHFLFTGVLVKRIQDTATTQQQLHPDVEIQTLNEIGLDPILFDLVRERELEAIAGQVTMNCEMCKFRLAASQEAIDLAHTHHHHHHDHHHHHGESDRYAKEEQYHKLVWQVP